MSYHSIESRRTIIELVICKNNQDGVFSLLSLDENCVTTEELESLHGVVGQSNDTCKRPSAFKLHSAVSISRERTVIIVDGIGHNQAVWLLLFLENSGCSIVGLVHISISFSTKPRQTVAGAVGATVRAVVNVPPSEQSQRRHCSRDEG
jgi:hypothetical protein